MGRTCCICRAPILTNIHLYVILDIDPIVLLGPMLRANERCRKFCHIYAVEELDGMDFAVGILKLEAKGSNTLDLQATSDTSHCGSLKGLEVLEATSITRHRD